MSMSTKSFPLTAVLGLATGRSWGPFSEIHEAAEHVMGHPIWTHEFASEALFAEMRRRVIAAHPGLADVGPDACPTSNDDLAERLAVQVARFGATLDLPLGGDVRTKSPMETAVEMVGAERVVVVATPTPTTGG